MKQKLCMILVLSGHTLIHASSDNNEYNKIKRTRTLARISLLTQKNHHEYKQLECVDCGYTVESSRKGNFDRHIRRKHQTHPFLCQRADCRQSFNNHELLKKHIMKGHGTSPQEIAQYFMLDSRTNTQNDTSDLKCPDCHEVISRKWRGNFSRHMRRWHNIDPYYCLQLGCLKSFANHDEFKKHIRNEQHNQMPPVKVVENIKKELPALKIDMIDEQVIFLDYIEQIPLQISPLSQLNLVSDSQLNFDDPMQ